jgi:hypothetical protein
MLRTFSLFLLMISLLHCIKDIVFIIDEKALKLDFEADFCYLKFTCLEIHNSSFYLL